MSEFSDAPEGPVVFSLKAATASAYAMAVVAGGHGVTGSPAKGLRTWGCGGDYERGAPIEITPGAPLVRDLPNSKVGH